MNRRSMLRTSFRALAAAPLAQVVAGCSWWPDGAFVNPCLAPTLPDDLAAHPLVRDAWHGIDPASVWDCHAHVFGTGDSGGGAWVNPAMYRYTSPFKLLQRHVYENAACVSSGEAGIDVAVVARMVALLDGFNASAPKVALAANGSSSASAIGSPAGQAKVLLYAFDWFHDERGQPDRERSTFHVPDSYARNVARAHPAHFEWVASIHPYRSDAVVALERARAEGALGVKWLPAAMGIDPSSPRCDSFFATLARLDIPLICHCGEELAVDGDAHQKFGNPLRMRRALDSGVRVVIAHCASLGSDADFDNGEREVASFELFARLMREPRYAKLLHADISALPQTNRAAMLPVVLERSEWHGRLLNGSDYPLPGVMPLFSMRKLAGLGILDPAAIPVLQRIREHNALLFDFVLKRSLRAGSRAFDAGIFATRAFFDPLHRRDRHAATGGRQT